MTNSRLLAWALFAYSGETSWTKPDPKPAPKPAVAETEAVKPEEAEAAKGEKETGEKESGVNADITAKAAAAADGAVVGDGDWAYTAEEAAENDKAAKKPEPEVRQLRHHFILAHFSALPPHTRTNTHARARRHHTRL